METIEPIGSPPSSVALTHRQILVAFSGLLLVMLLAALDSTIVSTALPTIVGELGGLEHLGWVVTGYLLAQTIVTPVYGKLGDLYGRKKILQSAIVLFLAGSALCGLSRSMTQLILFRAIQGLGGGGLAVTTQAVVGDIIPPRDRGRYQGVFGAVFGLASIAGPLLGGYFTSHWTWRWIFYINLPLGFLALAVLGATLPGHSQRREHAIDYAGAAVFALLLSGVTLVSDLGGTSYPWSSAPMLALIAIAIVSLIAFIAVERRATEPVLPLRLFRQQTFAVTSAVGFVVGFALFGAATYLPVYLQIVKGASPTRSGMQMLPMMAGMLATSILSGQLISRTGRYRLFPIAGTAVMTAGLFLLSRLTAASTMAATSAIILLLGIGLGMVMQVLVIAVQNAVDYRDLGVATSGATLFRLVGGSLGTAVLGATLASRLSSNLAHLLPAGSATAGHGATGGMNAATLAHLPPAARDAYLHAFTASLDTVFLIAAVVCAVGFALTWLLPERPLRGTVAEVARDAGTTTGDTFARPLDEEGAEAQLYAALASMADRDVQRQHIQRIVDRAGLTLTPLAAWLLVQIECTPEVSPASLGAARAIPVERVERALEELRSHRLIGEPATRDASAPTVPVTAAGCTVLERLVTARRAHLAELAADWDPARDADMAAYLRSAVHALIPNVRRSA